MKVSQQDMEHESVKDRILKEALFLFSERGFEGASLQSIADAVGIQKPSLLYHFPTKELLRQQVLESLVIYWKTELPRVLTPKDSGPDRLVSTMTSLINFFLEDINRARLVVREMLDRPQETFSLLNEHFSPWTRLIGDYLRLGQQSRLYRADIDPEAFIVQVMVLVVGSVAMGNVTSGIVSTESYALRGRLMKELLRIVQASLYSTPRA